MENDPDPIAKIKSDFSLKFPNIVEDIEAVEEWKSTGISSNSLVSKFGMACQIPGSFHSSLVTDFVKCLFKVSINRLVWYSYNFIVCLGFEQIRDLFVFHLFQHILLLSHSGFSFNVPTKLFTIIIWVGVPLSAKKLTQIVLIAFMIWKGLGQTSACLTSDVDKVL